MHEPPFGQTAPAVLRLRANFQGHVIRGLTGDNVGLLWSGKQVVILGHGPFAIEQARTALEHRSANVLLLVRRHGLVCPAVVDYLVCPIASLNASLAPLMLLPVCPTARSEYCAALDESFEHSGAGSGMMLSHWRTVYRLARATPPETWAEGIFRPDGHRLSVRHLLRGPRDGLGTHRAQDRCLVSAECVRTACDTFYETSWLQSASALR